MSPQQSIAHYRVVSKLGEGGMGEVWRATDTKLGRDVAIKVLPESFAADPDRMARFQREAQVLASLNHPNIAAIYGIEQGAIVMELVDGTDLAGPLPVETVIDYARQMAAGLEAAHEKGIVHRDLKPANIKVTRDGVVKLLDFGLAKAQEESGTASSVASPTMSPTRSIAMTQMGMILGTAAYMSPEQARGKPVDKRADIWAFGVILYELLAGRHLYGGGETVTDTLAAVVLKEADLGVLPADTPARLRRLIERCLKKDPKLRLRDIGEARLLLEEPDAPAIAAAAPAKHSGGGIWMAAAAAMALGLAALAVVHFRESAPPRETVRFTVQPPEGGAFPAGAPGMALSPDGRKLAFTASASAHAGQPAIWLRSLDSTELRLLPETEGGIFGFWSPDSRFLIFNSAGKLKKIDTAGGPPQTLCAVGSNAPTNGHWTTDGWVYFPNGRTGIFRVAQAGGDPLPVTKVDSNAGELFHAYPHVLADGRHLLVWVYHSQAEESAVYLFSLDGKEKKRITASVHSFAYVPPLNGESLGYLLITRQEAVMAQPVHPQTMELAGDPFPVADHVGNTRSYGYFTASQSGALAFRQGTTIGSLQLTWLDRAGNQISSVGAPGEFNGVALSRDGKRAALVQNENGSNVSSDLWIHDLARDVPSRFTFGGSGAMDPVWSPDGNTIAFGSRRDGPNSLYLKNANGTSQEELLQKSEILERPSDWSPDGRYLIYSKRTSTGAIALWTVTDPLDPARRKASAYLADGHATTQGQFSPGPEGGPRWVAYTSNESKANYEIFVQSFPAGAGKFQVSRGGGTQPRWRRDGKELFYIALDGKMMAVDVKTAPRFEAGIPHALFDSQVLVPVAQVVFRYDVTPDGQRFLVIRRVEGEGRVQQPITVVLNWLAGVRK